MKRYVRNSELMCLYLSQTIPRYRQDIWRHISCQSCR